MREYNTLTTTTSKTIVLWQLALDPPAYSSNQITRTPNLINNNRHQTNMGKEYVKAIQIPSPILISRRV